MTSPEKLSFELFYRKLRPLRVLRDIQGDQASSGTAKQKLTEVWLGETETHLTFRSLGLLVTLYYQVS